MMMLIFAEIESVGFSVGTVRILSDIRVTNYVNGTHENDFSSLKLKLRTLGSKVTIRKSRTEDKDVVWSCEVEEPPMRLPLKRRNAYAYRLFSALRS